MAPLTARAARDIAALAEHYTRLERPEALRNLADAVEGAQREIPQVKRHLAAPAPYPQIARPGTAWIKVGRYWFAYGTRRPHAIRAVVYETANLPSRF